MVIMIVKKSDRKSRPGGFEFNYVCVVNAVWCVCVCAMGFKSKG